MTQKGLTRRQLLEENAKMLLMFLETKGGGRSMTDDWSALVFSSLTEEHENIVIAKGEVEIDNGNLWKVTIKQGDITFSMFDFLVNLDDHLLILGKMDDDKANIKLFEWLMDNYQANYLLLGEKKGGEIREIEKKLEEQKDEEPSGRLTHQQIMILNGKKMVDFFKGQGIDVNEHWQKCHFQEGDDTFTIERALIMNEDADGKRQLLDGCMLIIEPDSNISLAPQRFAFTEGKLPIMTANGNVMEDQKLRMFLQLITSVPFKLTKKEME